MVNSNTPALSVGIGRRIADLRRPEGVTAEDVAEAARAVGLRWQAGTICFIETGRRAISADELLMLPVLMSRALRRPVTLRDLMPEQAKVSGAVAFTPTTFDKILAGEPIRYRAQPSQPARRKAAVG